MNIIKITCIILFVMAGFGTAAAQQETIRQIALVTGGKLTIIKNVLPAQIGETRVYIIRGVKGQRVKIDLDLANQGAADFSFKLPNGELLNKANSTNIEWNGILPETGEYKISVFNRSAANANSKYSLKIVIN